MIRIGEDCQSVGKVDHILMKAAGRILRRVLIPDAACVELRLVFQV